MLCSQLGGWVSIPEVCFFFFSQACSVVGFRNSFFFHPSCHTVRLLSAVDLWSVRVEAVLGEDEESRVFKVGPLARSLNTESLAGAFLWGFRRWGMPSRMI